MSEEKARRTLPAPAPGGRDDAVVASPGAFGPPANFNSTYSYVDAEPEEPTIALSHYFWILNRHKWRILIFVLALVVVTVVISSRLTPIYQSTATIDVDRQMPAALVGQDADRAAPNDADQFLATQIEIIQSDSVLRPVAERFHIPVTSAPVALGGLEVTRPPNTYLLLIRYRSPDPELAANVANGAAQSYIDHTYDIRFRAAAGLSTFMEQQMDELKTKMDQSATALAQFEKDLSVIDPEEKTTILSSRLLQLNTEFTNAQADTVRKLAAYNSVKDGSLEAAEASEQGEQLRALADRIDGARENFAPIAAQYGVNHPEYQKAKSQLDELQRQMDALKAGIEQRVRVEYQEAADREAMLKKSVAEAKAEVDSLNQRAFEYKALKQEADSDRALYEELIQKIREAGINSNFQSSSIRLADPARPASSPVFPNLRLNALIAFFLSTLLAVGVAATADVMDNTVRDPEDIQRGLGAEVLGSLPVVRPWRRSLFPVPSNGHNQSLRKVTPLSGQTMAFEESVKTLRYSILLTEFAERPRSLLVTSAVPREGKTTCAVHLAIAHSLHGHKTLLIDADLPRPAIHMKFGFSNERGLCDVARGEATWRDALQRSESHPNLDVLVAGAASRLAAERLGDAFKELLAEVEKEYDLVIVDSPPLLGFAEPLQMAVTVGGVVLVTLAGRTDRNAVRNVLGSLRRLNANVVGVALNQVREDMSDRYYYPGYCGKYYAKYYRQTGS